MRVIALLFILILPALALKEIVARWQNDIDHSVKLQAVEGKPDWVLSFYDGEDLIEIDLPVVKAQRLQEGWQKAKTRAFQLRPNQEDEAGSLAPVLQLEFDVSVTTEGVHEVGVTVFHNDDLARVQVTLDGPSPDVAPWEALLLRAQRAPDME